MKKKDIVMLSISIFLIIIMTTVSFHLIQADFPSLKNNTNYIYQPYIPAQGQRIVCICFDDGWLSAYINATPILNQYGFKATFGIITQYADYNYPAYMNWSDIEKLAKNGEDIASHTYNHIALATLDNASIIYQLSQSKQDLNSHGINTQIFVYPYGSGSENASVESLVQKYYLSARGITENPLNITQPFDKFALPAYGILNTTTLPNFAKFVNQANNSTIVVIYYHKIDNENVDTATTPQLFASEMQYLKDNNFTVMTLQQLFTSKDTND
jgi:peptidoglycan/xylan/chitin deacetylase (PgdA/CDA1 family)